MVDYMQSAEIKFDASHQVDKVPGCKMLHGHTFTVRAAVSGNLEADEEGVRRVQYYEDLAQLENLREELDERHLNDMMPGVVTTPEGVAAWFLERLPNVDHVEVTQGWRRTTGRATRNKKR